MEISLKSRQNVRIVGYIDSVISVIFVGLCVPVLISLWSYQDVVSQTDNELHGIHMRRDYATYSVRIGILFFVLMYMVRLYFAINLIRAASQKTPAYIARDKANYWRVLMIVYFALRIPGTVKYFIVYGFDCAFAVLLIWFIIDATGAYFVELFIKEIDFFLVACSARIVECRSGTQSINPTAEIIVSNPDDHAKSKDESLKQIFLSKV